MKKTLLTRAFIGAFLFWLCALPLLAHPFASYLDGAFVSFGLDTGLGDVMESVSNTSTNTTAEQIYKAKLSAFDQALANLKNNREQTIKALQNLAQQLLNANPASPTLNQLIAQINALAQNPGAKDLVANLDSSLSTYQQYLDGIINSYQSANEQLLKQAQNQLAQYKAQVGPYIAANQKILENAVKYFNNFNTKIGATAKNLGITYTPLTLPAPLNKISASATPAQIAKDVANLTPQQTTIALQALGDEINKIISITNGDIQGLSNANQKIAIENANKLSNLIDAKNTAITQALDQITGLTEIVGRAFHNQWMRYADGHTFFLKNGTTGKQYINAGDTCVFQIIIHNNTDAVNHCGYEGGSEGALQSFQKSAAKYGLTPQQIWNTLFNVAELQKNIYIGPSNCSRGDCSGVNPQTAIAGMQSFFNFMNGYIGMGNPGFVGNFANTASNPSSLYSKLSNALSGGDFTTATNLVNAYVNTFVPDMLQTFVLNPVWLMSLVPGAHTYNGPPATPSASNKSQVIAKWNSPNVKYCYDSPAIGLNFSQGYAVCGYNWWAQAMFMGYFGYLSNQTGTLISVLQAELTTNTQTAINNAQTATNNYNHPNPPYKNTYTVPNIPPYATGPLPTPPQVPLLSFSSNHFLSNSLRLGVQLQGGYQKYFTPFFGISYYGYFGYRYLYMQHYNQSNLMDTNRYSLGFGVNVLSNFYSKIRKAPNGRVKIQAYGVFGGLLTTFNIWSAHFLQNQAQIRTDANINAVMGLSVRVNQFKWSLGVRLPLIERRQNLDIRNKDGQEGVLTFIDSYKNPQIFLDFTRIF
ncbi:outer membrane beta-barrel protein [Helicobacter mehlei]|uniref:outer membrane beta-barrel protein n=1 Tax=Helicobacter mehlei TaxID=2316080 RepID=UPI001F3344D9|nr:outer membrane beta-barrel protein [Helicobacter mehlei]